MSGVIAQGLRTPPRVLVVGLGLEMSGSGRFLSGLAAQLQRSGLSPEVFVVRGGPLLADLEAAGVRVTIADDSLPESASRSRLGFASAARLLAYVRETQPDVIHTNLIGLDMIGRCAAWLTGTRVVVSTQHDMNPRPWFVDVFRWATVGRISATVACSQPVATYCRDVMRVPDNKLVVIDNGIDVGRFTEVSWPKTTTVEFMTIGALVPLKAHELLISAFAWVVAEDPQARLTIVGEGPLREALVEYIRSLGLSDVARVLAPSPDVASLLSSCHIYVQPSHREGLPLAVLEAMAASRPVIATDVSSHSWILDGGNCGALVEPSNAGALAAAMLDMAADLPHAQALGANGRNRALECFSIERMSSEYAQLYARLAEEAS